MALRYPMLPGELPEDVLRTLKSVVRDDQVVITLRNLGPIRGVSEGLQGWQQAENEESAFHFA